MLARTAFPAGTNEADLYAYDHADQLTGIEMTQGEEIDRGPPTNPDGACSHDRP